MMELIKTATAPAAASERQLAQPRAIEAAAATQSPGTDTGAKSAEDRKADIERMQAAIERLAASALKDSKLSIEKHEDAGMFVYTLVDSTTGSVMRQWPQKELVELKEYLRTRQAGLVDERA